MFPRVRHVVRYHVYRTSCVQCVNLSLPLINRVSVTGHAKYNRCNVKQYLCCETCRVLLWWSVQSVQLWKRICGEFWQILRNVLDWLGWGPHTRDWAESAALALAVTLARCCPGSPGPAHLTQPPHRSAAWLRSSTALCLAMTQSECKYRLPPCYSIHFLRLASPAALSSSWPACLLSPVFLFLIASCPGLHYSAACCLLSAVCCFLSAVCCLLSAVCWF